MMGKFSGCKYLENAGFAFVEVLQFTIMFSLDKVIDSASMCHGSQLFMCQKNLSNMASSELSSTSSPIALEDEQSYGCHAVRHIVVCSPLCVWHTLLQNNSTSTSHSLMAQANRLDCVVETMSLTHDQDLIFGSSLVQTLFYVHIYQRACEKHKICTM